METPGILEKLFQFSILCYWFPFSWCCFSLFNLLYRSRLNVRISWLWMRWGWMEIQLLSHWIIRDTSGDSSHQISNLKGIFSDLSLSTISPLITIDIKIPTQKQWSQPTFECYWFFIKRRKSWSANKPYIKYIFAFKLYV